jgi:hypothetical protein
MKFHTSNFKSSWWKFLVPALLCACNTAVVNSPIQPAAVAAPVKAAETPSGGTTYEVGPNQKLRTPNDVPWNSLKAGDTVLIHWRAEPYKNKWVIAVEGTEHAPITIRGVNGPNGALPVIDGEDATTSKHCDYWGEVRSIVKIGGARNANKLGSKWVVIENLDIGNARPKFTYTSGKGKTEKYDPMAAGIWVEHADHLIIRNCTLHNCGNGLFVSSNNQLASEDILIEKCHIFDNGDPSGQRHNVYTAAKGIIFQYNWLGSPRKGANNLKDRSSGCIIRYNWIDGGDKLLDLVDAEDSKIIRQDPRYRQTFVYGNIMIKGNEPGHDQVVHYGGDSGRFDLYRKGTLYFYNNTVVSKRRATQLFWFPTDDEICDCRNNIFFTEGAGKSLALLRYAKGILQLSHNYFKAGFRKTAEANKPPIVRDDKTSVIGASPGFVDDAKQDFHLQSDSPCRGKATELAPAALPVDHEYKKPQDSALKPTADKNDVGAY